MQEKSFEQKLHSLQIGCIIIGLLQLFSLVSAINNYSDGTGGLGTLILSILILLDIIFAYYFTSKKNPIGPVLEYIFGVLSKFDEYAAEASKAGLRTVTENDVLGWRFWMRYLGHAYQYNKTLIRPDN